LIGTRDLAIYAAIVATADVLWTLFQGLFRDRPRIVVRVAEAEAITPGTNQRQPMLMCASVTVGGGPSTSRTSVGWRTSGAESMRCQATSHNSSRTPSGSRKAKAIRSGTDRWVGGYRHGDLPLKRWYVTDGGERVHPLRERYRQRIENVILWPVRRFLRWRERRST
jgi:hypothetical protein